MKKTFSVRHSDAREIPGLSFSPDGKYLVGFARPHPVQGATGLVSSFSTDNAVETPGESDSAMETTLLYWNVDKSTVLLFFS